MRSVIRGVIFAAIALVLVALAGVAYGVGVNVGVDVATQVAIQNGQPVAVVPYGHGWHGGIGFFGILFWILAILLFFGLLRAAFGRGRWGRHSGWDRGYGPGGWKNGSGGDRIAEWHRELHRREESGGTGSAPTGSTPTS